MGTTNKTAGQTATNNTTATAKVATIFARMAPAIIKAHNLGNNKAISRDFALGCGVDEIAFDSWVNWVGRIHEVCTKWAGEFNSKDVSDAKLGEHCAKVLPMWKTLLTVSEGVAELGHRNIFTREDADVYRLMSFAIKHGHTAKASCDVKSGVLVFRKEIETMIGNRIAQSVALTEEQYQTVTSYESAKHRIDGANKRLNGYTSEGGKAVKGLKDDLVEAEAKLEEMRKLALELGVDEAKLEESTLLSGYVATVASIKSDIDDANKTIDDANKIMEDLKPVYDKIMNLVKIAK